METHRKCRNQNIGHRALHRVLLLAPDLMWLPGGWADYLWWQETDRKGLARVNELIRDTLRSPFSGIGKPEPLRGNLKGWWSRRITQEHRLVYRCENETIIVMQCGSTTRTDFNRHQPTDIPNKLANGGAAATLWVRSPTNQRCGARSARRNLRNRLLVLEPPRSS